MARPVVGFVSRLLGNGLRGVQFASRGLERRAKANALWLRVPLGAEVGERNRAVLGASREAGPCFLDLLRSLERVAGDARIAGVLLHFQGSGPHRFNQAAALRRRVDRLREAGVPVVAWAESLTAAQLWIASGADVVWLPESGVVQLVGLRTEQFFLKDLLDKLEVEPEVVHVGRYKSAGEIATRRSMSPEQREQTEAWLTDLYRELVEAIGTGRGLEPGEVRERIDRGPYAAAAAREAGLIDAFLYADELEEALRPLSRGSNSSRDVAFLDLARYFASVVQDPGWRPLLRDLPKLAYVVATGNVLRGTSRRGIGSVPMGRLLARVREDDRISGVVLRVDSPGGDAVASDLLYRAVELTALEKPVVVSMGEVAASGGYYLAAAANAIWIEPGSLTGSIGVVGGKVNLEGLYRRLGVGRDAVEMGARAGLFSEARGFTPDERRAVGDEMKALYDVFLKRVAAGRELDPEAVERVARGRIWSGRTALDVGLVDGLGGPLEAIDDARRRAGIGDGERYQLEVHPRRSLLPDLRAMLMGAEV
ncbi:MAG: signal peptide peptidase SppA [Myxococcota bacterium]|nr:signal peptide peptidase SppA [Myxococcota bacterium]